MASLSQLKGTRPDKVEERGMRINGESLILGEVKARYSEILTVDAQRFLILLHRNFEGRRQDLLIQRKRRQDDINRGVMPTFLPETEHIRNDKSWKAAPPGRGLEDRRVEITGSVDRKMIINALNSNATQFMADFEDSTSPTWVNIMDGQVNLKDAIERKISFTSPNGKHYKLSEGKLPVIIVRPRGWHLQEQHFLVDGKPMSASLFDFALYFYHNAKATISSLGQGPYYYLPKLEGHLEARLWNDVFNFSQDFIGIPRGTIRATVLIETILAAFEMEEIIFELKEHSAGLNCGRWDYIFSFIKKFHKYPEFVLPDRSLVTMNTPFMKAYVDLLIQTCHGRKVHAMGGMAAQIPIKADPIANELALRKVCEDKRREVLAGHDGTWVAHPDLIAPTMEIFNENMTGPNQLYMVRKDVKIDPEQLVSHETNQVIITKRGISDNVKIALIYLGSWLCGIGCVPINNLMEDAATAEISRSQLWQWAHHSCLTSDTNEKIDMNLIQSIIEEEASHIKQLDAKSLNWAKSKLLKIVECEEFEEFITTICYPDIVNVQGTSKF